MKKFNLLALLLIILGVASAKAQVSIGTANDPHAGAILDLQSNAKGLLLPHVELLDLEILQVGGSGAGEDLTATGMIVYNINSNFCQGVYVWNGSQWRKVGKDYQVRASAPDNLKITAPDDVQEIVGGEAVTFKATSPGNAQFFSWYLNDTLLETTKSSIFTTTAIRAGTNQKMKVVMDDCLSLSSDEITFEAKNIYPAAMPTAGNDWIRIYNGNPDSPFPYAATSEYIQNGLVAHYDGINNQNIDDKTHSSDAVVWKDLSGNGYDVNLRKGHGTQTRKDAIPVANITQCTGAQWDSNGFLFNDYSYFARVPSNPSATNALSEIMPQLPYENDNFTLESVFDPTLCTTTNGGIAGWGTQEDYKACSVRFYEMPSDKTKPQFRNHWWSCDVSVKFTDAGLTNVKNLAVTYDNNPSASPNNRTFYYNGTTNSIQYIDTNCGTTTNNCREKTNKNTAKSGSFFVGQSVGVNTYDNAPRDIYVYENSANRYSNGNKIFSVRVYNRTLTPAEVSKNYNVDKLRFTSPPKVWIGTQQCANVTVLSPRVLTCKVPANSGQPVNTPLNVKVFQSDGTTPILEYGGEFIYTAQ
jgi:hypothetical protein